MDGDDLKNKTKQPDLSINEGINNNLMQVLPAEEQAFQSGMYLKEPEDAWNCYS